VKCHAQAAAFLHAVKSRNINLAHISNFRNKQFFVGLGWILQRRFGIAKPRRPMQYQRRRSLHLESVG